MEHGWRRETVINGVSRTGVVKGEVTYYSPCGRRFKQYPDVVRVSVTVHATFIYMCIMLTPYEKVKGEVVPVCDCDEIWGAGGKAAQICNLLGKPHNWSCWNSEVLSINETVM